MEKSTRFSVSEKILDGVMKYLGNRPFVETAGLITSLQQDAKPIEEAEEINEAPVSSAEEKA